MSWIHNRLFKAHKALTETIIDVKCIIAIIKLTIFNINIAFGAQIDQVGAIGIMPFRVLPAT